MWQGIEGHDELVQQFRQRLKGGRLASTFLFVGPSGIGKRSFAVKLAQALLCQQQGPDPLAPCGRCPSCTQVTAGTHPDLLQVAKPPERSEIPLSLLIGSKEKRMRQGLCHDIGMKPFMGGYRVAIIDDADHLNEEGANCLLKTLEEPPPHSLMILIGTSAVRQLPTIRSRAQIVRFRPLATEVVARLLLAREVVSGADKAHRLAAYSEGSLQRAVELADEELWLFRRRLLERLAEPPVDSVQLIAMVSAFVEEAGTEAPARRTRTRVVIGFVAEFYRQLVRVLSGAEPTDDPQLRQYVEHALMRTPWTDPSTDPAPVEIAAACAEVSLEALWHVDRNANQATMLQCWLDDVTQIMMSRLPPQTSLQ